MSTYEMEDLTELLALLWPPEILLLDMAIMRNTAMDATNSFHAFDMTRRARTIGVVLVVPTSQMQAAVSGWVNRIRYRWRSGRRSLHFSS